MEYVYSLPLEGTEEEGYTSVYRNADYKNLMSCDDFFDGKIKTGWDVFQRGLSLSPEGPCFGSRVKDEQGVFGEFKFMTYKEVKKTVQEFGSGLLNTTKMGEVTLKELNTKVKMLGIYSQNTPEWLMCEQVCNGFGLTLVPLYDTLGEESTLYILDSTGLNVLVCDYNCALKILKMVPRTKGSLNTVVVTGVSELTEEMKRSKSPQYKTWDEVVLSGRDNLREFTPATPGGINTISYTSGVSSIPKGALITHHQHTSLVTVVNRIVCNYEVSQIPSPKVHLSYLPLSHMYERLYISCTLIQGSKIGVFSGEIKNVLDDMKCLCPDVFPSVPRLYMRIHDKVQSAVSQKNFLVRFLFNMGLNSKIKKIKRTGVVTHSFWDRLLFKKFNTLLGGNVNWMLTGSAPLSPAIFDKVRALFSIPLLSGYGLTETCAGAFITKKYEQDSSHVGGPVPSLEFRLKSLPDFNYYVTDKYPRGELMLRGHNIIKYYFKDDKNNEESFSDGWFLTGDIAELLPNGALRIIDRRKNIFKLAQGEYISPEKVESVLASVPILCQAYVTGKSEYVFPVAVVVPDEQELELWSKRNGCTNLSRAQVISMPEFRGYLTQEVEKAFEASNLKGFEKVKVFHIESELFSIENDLLTTTSKLKRRNLFQKYSEVLDGLVKGKTMSEEV